MPQTGEDQQVPRDGDTGAAAPPSGGIRGFARRIAPYITGREPGGKLSLPQTGMDRDAKRQFGLLALVVFGTMIAGISVVVFDLSPVQPVATAVPTSPAPASPEAAAPPYRVDGQGT